MSNVINSNEEKQNKEIQQEDAPKKIDEEVKEQIKKQDSEMLNQTFNNKTLETTAKTLNKVNFSRSRELADKYAEQLVDSAARYGQSVNIDTIKEKLGADLFRNLKQTSLK